MAPPPPKTRTLPAGFFDDSSTPSSQPTKPAPKAALPSGFFDDEGSAESSKQLEVDSSSSGGLVGLAGYGDSDDEDSGDDNDDNEGAGTTATQSLPNVAAASTVAEPSMWGPGPVLAVAPEDNSEESGPPASALPVGFFDNEDADMKVRGIEPEKVAKAAETAEVDAFMEFAAEVAQEESVADDDAASLAAAAASRARVEQALYMNRLAGVLHKAKDGDDSGSASARNPSNTAENSSSSSTSSSSHGQTSPEVPDVSAVLVEAADLADSEGQRSGGVSAVSEVASLLKKRKKRRRELEDDAATGEYIPLDPTNWRAKAVAPSFKY
jgi:hypothetical protein